MAHGQAAAGQDEAGVALGDGHGHAGRHDRPPAAGGQHDLLPGHQVGAGVAGAGVGGQRAGRGRGGPAGSRSSSGPAYDRLHAGLDRPGDDRARPVHRGDRRDRGAGHRRRPGDRGRGARPGRVRSRPRSWPPWATWCSACTRRSGLTAAVEASTIVAGGGGRGRCSTSCASTSPEPGTVPAVRQLHRHRPALPGRLPARARALLPLPVDRRVDGEGAVPAVVPRRLRRGARPRPAPTGPSTTSGRASRSCATTGRRSSGPAPAPAPAPAAGAERRDPLGLPRPPGPAGLRPPGRRQRAPGEHHARLRAAPSASATGTWRPTSTPPPTGCWSPSTTTCSTGSPTAPGASRDLPWSEVSQARIGGEPHPPPGGRPRRLARRAGQHRRQGTTPSVAPLADVIERTGAHDRVCVGVVLRGPRCAASAG